jgi:hypothetical protein
MQGGLHVERGVTRPHGVILVRERSPEEGHYPIPGSNITAVSRA